MGKRSLPFTAKITALFLCILFLSSCAWMRKEIVEISKSDVKNAQALRTASKNFLSTWRINSGFIRGVLKDRLDQFPKGTIEAMDELDELCKKTEWDDFELGYSVGLRVHILGDLIKNTLKIYAPNVLKFLSL